MKKAVGFRAEILGCDKGYKVDNWPLFVHHEQNNHLTLEEVMRSKRVPESTIFSAETRMYIPMFYPSRFLQLTSLSKDQTYRQRNHK